MKKLYTCLCYIMIIAILATGNVIGVQAKTSGKSPTQMGNLVVFVTLKDDPTAGEMSSAEGYAKIKDLYDDGTSFSFSKYLEEVSYGQLLVENIFPQDKGTYFDTMELPYTHEDFADYGKDVLLVDYVLDNLDATVNNNLIDKNGDNTIDHLTIFIHSDPGSSMDEYPTLWPHKSNYTGDATYNGLNIGAYNVMSSTRSYESSIQGAGVAVHEFMHSIGYPDLYTYDNTSPVGNFDIMSIADGFMQYPLAYMRAAISGWLTIDEITESTTDVTLDLQSNADGNQAYIIKSPLNSYEFFVVEYRKQGDSLKNELDSKIGSEGIIVYRIDTSIPNLSNKGDVPAVYIFRDQSLANPEGVDAAKSAALSAQNGRTTIGSSDLSHGLTDGALTFQDGSNSGIVISDVSASGGKTMTFDVTIPEAGSFDLWNDAGFVDTNPTTKTLDSVLGNDGMIYLLEARDSKLILHKQNGDAYAKLTEFNAGNSSSVAESDLFLFKNELYASYVNYGDTNDVVILKFNSSSNAFENYTTVQNAGDQSAYEISVDNENIYIVYASGGMASEQNLAKITNGSVEVLGVYSEESGRPDIVLNNGKIYVFNRLGTNDIKMYEYTGSGFTAITSTNFNSNSFDVISYANKIYLLTGDSGIKLHSFDGSTWTTEATMSLSGFAPKLTVSQGNLYLITSTGSSSGNTEAFRVDLTSKSFIKEGYNIDVSSSNYNIISIGEALYATYVGKDSKILVKLKESSNKLISITVTPPTKTDYIKGGEIDENGLTVVANYEQEQRALDRNQYTVTGFDTSVVGERVATVTFGDIVRNFEYNVSEKEVSSLSLLQTPTKTAYTEGETVDTTGLKVQAEYIDNTTAEVPINSLTTTPNRPLTTTDTEVVVSYAGKSVSYGIVVNEAISRDIISLEITTQPSDKDYLAGETFNTSKMVVKATYDNGDVDNNFTGYTVSYQNGSAFSKGDTKVTLSADSVTVDVIGISVMSNVTEVEVTIDSNAGTGKFIVKVPSTMTSDLKTVYVPTWSAENGQDDIVWYKATKQSDGTYVVNFDVKNHKYNLGYYKSHVYIENMAGTKKYAAGTNFSVEPSSSKITVDGDTIASVRTIELSNSINQKGNTVRAAVWSDEGGQDDLRWINMTLSGEKYTLPLDMNSFKSAGNYVVHLYRYDGMGKSSYITGTRFNVERITKTSFTISDLNQTSGTAKFTIEPDAIIGGIKTVYVPTWSSINGQDDIVWYKAIKQSDGTYLVNFNVRNHNYSIGKYSAHLHIENIEGTRKYVSGTSFSIEPSSSKITVDSNTTSSVRTIELSNAINQKGQTVKAAIWSIDGGQDDLRWFNAKLSDGKYSLTIDMNSFESAGDYVVHLYRYDSAGKSSYITGTRFKVERTTKAEFTINNLNQTHGTAKFVIATDAFVGGIKTVYVPTWSVINGQDDIVWYKATRQSNGTYVVNFSMVNHKFSVGTYNMHVYIENLTGVRKFVRVANLSIDQSNN